MSYAPHTDTHTQKHIYVFIHDNY